MANILDKALRLGEAGQLKKLRKIADDVCSLDGEWSELTDEQLKAKTAEFKRELAAGKTLDDVMVEAFATVREAAWRVLGLKPFPVQIMGGAALHRGAIAEMKTGEGKSLVCVLPGYLNALEGKGVHIVTVNDYLAKYGADQMSRVYRALGLTTGCVLTDQEPAERKRQYDADVTYGTNTEFGFDYLRDNMAVRREDMVQRGHHYAIVDEVDSILIDEARTPLIIAGPAEGEASRWYAVFAKLVRTLQRDRDYTVDEKKKTISITDDGVERAEKWLGVDQLYTSEHTMLVGCLDNAIKAKELYLLDRDYVIRDGEALIVDEHTGRVLDGRRYSDGLHQAIEAKEGVEVQAENQTYATVTLQNYFRMYDKLAGMTGTAETEAAEFMKTYNLSVIPIPTNKPVQRVDRDDLVYLTKKDKLAAVVSEIAARHEKGQPVLVGTASVEDSELLHQLLDVAGIKHQVLNAKQDGAEAAVVAMAGRKGAVTVATNMAGRGTDIMLGGNVEFIAAGKMRDEYGLDPDSTPEEYDEKYPEVLAEAREQVKTEHEEVKDLGGLFVLGTERHESRRIDNQLRGRAGRQGDPGESRFYLSLEDDLMRLFNTQLVARMMRSGFPEGEPIESKMVTKGVRRAQKARESQNYEIRKNVLKYDDVMNKQRIVVYADRQLAMDGQDLTEDVRGFARQVVSEIVDSGVCRLDAEGEPFEGKLDKPTRWRLDDMLVEYAQAFHVSKLDDGLLADKIRKRQSLSKNVQGLKDALADAALKRMDEWAELFGEKTVEEESGKVIRAVIDECWRKHLYEMDYLKTGIGLRGMGQRDPLVEYQRDGYASFVEMEKMIRQASIKTIYRLFSDRQCSLGTGPANAKPAVYPVAAEPEDMKSEVKATSSNGVGDALTEEETGSKTIEASRGNMTIELDSTDEVRLTADAGEETSAAAAGSTPQ